MAPTQQFMKVKMQDLEWCANWKMDDRYYCSIFNRNSTSSKGFDKLLENMFGTKYGGFRYDQRLCGYEVWFRKKEDMLTLKLLSGKKQ